MPELCAFYGILMNFSLKSNFFAIDNWLAETTYTYIVWYVIAKTLDIYIYIYINVFV